ncbi:MAG: methyltransferase family protein [Bacteroidota bacterium]
MTRPPSLRILFPPPLVYAGGFGIGWLLGRTWPIDLLPEGVRPVAVVLGWALIAMGLGMTMTGLFTFLLVHTGILPNRPSTTLVTTGLYRFTRNPMYVGMTLAYIGGVLLTDNAWCLAILFPVLAIIKHLVILREEKYLTAVFGEVYTEYCARVRRWV